MLKTGRELKNISNIVKKNMELTMSSDEFVKIELLLRLAERLGETQDVDILYMLISRQELIFKEKYDSKDFLIMNARVVLWEFTYPAKYRDVLEIYCTSDNKRYAMYTVEDNAIKKNPERISVYDDRHVDYDYILENAFYMQNDKRNLKKIKFDEIYLATVKPDKEIRIRFKELDGMTDKFTARDRKGTIVRMSVRKILEAADRIDMHEGSRYRSGVLENHIYDVIDNDKVPSSDFTIKGVCNVAGQVGAGKSTFADSLSVAAMDDGYRIVMILASVDDVIKKAELLDKMGYKVCTLIADSGRKRHIENQMRDRAYLSFFTSGVLQQPCLLNALTEEPNDIIEYGEEPCTSLKKPTDKNVNEKIRSETYVCPYYDNCPKTQNARKIKSADIVLTTLSGFSLCSFGKEKEQFMIYALMNFDLVIMDEIDNALCQLDDIFSTEISVEEFIRRTADYHYNYNKKGISNKKNRYEDELMLKIGKFAYLANWINRTVNDEKAGWKSSQLRDFSLVSLLKSIENRLKDSGEYGREIFSELEKLIKNVNVRKDEAELLYLAEESRFEEYMINKLSEVTCNSIGRMNEKNSMKVADNRVRKIEDKISKFDRCTQERINFILRVIAFQRIYEDIDNIVEIMDNLPDEFKAIIDWNCKRHRKLMPDTPLGRGISFRVNSDSISIKKQSVIGRLLALKMPYMILGSDGSPKGPNVLMMSGTGYIPGSNMYHVGDKVDYIIEAEKEKTDFISRTEMINVRSEYRISGQDDEKKDRNIGLLIQSEQNSIMRCVNNGERILMTVNSYEQAEIAYKAVDRILCKNKSNYRAYYLKPDSSGWRYEADGIEKSISRRNITKFDKEILIAPAWVIGRGYNIVDNLGNSWFDTVMFLVRPMLNPMDYKIIIQKINGYIMNNYRDRNYSYRIDVMKELRKESFSMYNALNYPVGALWMLEDKDKTDVIATLFVILQQVFGRLCRVGESVKEKNLKIYWMDGAFFVSGEKQFDTISELTRYLERIIENGSNSIVARTLYKPFYEALKMIKD
ncbi:hypothetical protein KQI85_09220 [Falcatimonas sp. MSJ-15]|uniref:pPIWI_RE_Z domain-containing protein n=1 Tax=Falcatimonas sp. MSJ-15 TaxID=2841515 RepID=UPI001C0F54D5|nr:hypothetical protein [Falcatimonas sp. MSJ-15]MBU5470554.1 hypothetical protein [Falcatimonas sp. MSJ-15]